MNLQTGAFGDPSSTETLILFWSKMEELHYPGAGTTKQYLEDKLERERQQAMMAQQMQMQQMAMQAAQQQAAAGGGQRHGRTLWQPFRAAEQRDLVCEHTY